MNLRRIRRGLFGKKYMPILIVTENLVDTSFVIKYTVLV